MQRKVRTRKPESLESLWEETQGKIERAIYDFAKATQLSKAFENYLIPRAEKLPSILVENSGPIDVNGIHLGVESSFRFPIRPKNKREASERISQTAQNVGEYIVTGKP